MARPPLRVAIACPGLGHVDRGYERYSADLAARLREDPALEVVVLQGGGTPATGDRRVRSLRREGRIASGAARLVGRRAGTGAHDGARGTQARTALLRAALGLRLPVDPYEIEQVTFALAALPALLRSRCDVVVVHDVLVAKVLHAVRARLRRGPAIVFVNGAPWPAPFDFADVVQHLTEPSRTEALEAGDPADRNMVVACAPRLYGPPADGIARIAARARLGLPLEGPILLSVGALNLHHKRHDHLVREVASMGPDAPYLVIAGGHDPEEDALRTLVAATLDGRADVRTVAADEMADLYWAADAFALASVVEGFGLAYVEAASAGLPVIAHDGAVPRWVLGDSGTFVDMTEPGQLAAAIRGVCSVVVAGPALAAGEARSTAIGRRYGWAALAPGHLAVLERAIERRSAA